MLWGVATTALAQTGVSGNITDNTGEPMPGVNVTVKGTTTGVVSDVDGKYSITVPNVETVLAFSFIGYETVEMRVGTRTTINVILKESSLGLDEVVVIGYGVVKKSDVTGSVVSVNSEEMMKRNPTTIGQGLQGAAAGVYVGRNGGPSGETTIRIRGAATINNSTDPLFVVDGIRVGTDVNFLNPADVESIEILKDASATAIYGSEGANGVVLITTKQGEKGRPRVSAFANYGVQTVTERLDVLDAPGFAKVARRAAEADDALVNTAWWNYADQLQTIDWQKEMSQTALSQNYNMNVSGGTDATRAVLSTSYANNDGVIINSNFRRLTARANIDHTVKKAIRVGMNVTYMYSEFRGAGSTDNLMRYAINPPTMDYMDASNNLVHVPVQYPNGEWGRYPLVGNDINKSLDNVVAASTDSYNSGNKGYFNRILTNGYLDVTFMKGLTLRTIGSLNYGAYSSHSYNPVNNRPIDRRTDDSDNFSITMNSGTTLSLESYLTWNLNIGAAHNISAMAGYSISRYKSMDAYGYSKYMPVPTIRRVELTQQTSTFNTSGGLGLESRQESFFGRVNYSLLSRYLLTATIRRDGSSNFGAGNRYGVFPSTSLAWRAIEEPFIKDLDLFSNLKLRLGWGQTGNAGRTSSLSVNQLSSDRIAFHYYGGSAFSTAPGLAQTREIDTNLKWETNESTNVGLDFGFANNTYSFTVDYFVRDAKDLLLDRTLRPSTGYESIYTNAGHIRNSGWEISATYQKPVGDWFYNIRLNASTLKNEVIDVGEPIYRSIGNGDYWTSSSITQNGSPIASYYGYRVDHIFQSQAEIDALNAKAAALGVNDGFYQKAGTKPGDYMYKDLNGDGYITPEEDREVFGHGFPALNYGLNVGVNYKSWDLSLYLYGVAGQKILSFAYRNLITVRNGTEGYMNILKEAAENAWTPENHSTTQTRLTRMDDNLNGQVSDAFLKDGDFLKIQNLQVGYTVPTKFLKPLLIDNVRIYAAVENLFTFTNYVANLDPEIVATNPDDYSNRNGNILWNGFDQGHYPLPRTYSFGISAGF
jgi:TonB-linked SusC/RagA family outer membrane protein